MPLLQLPVQSAHDPRDELRAMTDRDKPKRKRTRKDFIDTMNEVWAAINKPKTCPDPKCGGALLQHKFNPKAFFCCQCFTLYELKEATFARWHSLVSRKPPKHLIKGKTKSREKAQN